MILLFITLIASGIFITTTSAQLPAMVASHFAASGMPNGFMSHDAYVRFMLAFALGVPLLVALSSIALKNPNARINIPNRDYWLAPAHRAETIAYLRRHIAWFGALIALFLAYVHWLVVLANRTTPAILPSADFKTGFLVFFMATALWGITMVGKFFGRV